MSSLTKTLAHKSNWNGGNWTLDGEPVAIDPGRFNEVVILVDNDPNLRLVATIRSGVDYDMGHEYHWINTRLRVECTYQGRKFYSDVPDNNSVALPTTIVEQLWANGGLRRA